MLGSYYQLTTQTADSRQKSVTLEVTTANKQLVLTTATADKQLQPISAAMVPLREGPADVTYLVSETCHLSVSKDLAHFV